ncbi:hypothetical protein [Bartonella saheliensis]|uniref:hypothetical protein n=1 Tax=Bartonella saheliensis TaxID=1457016 RepID=UPI0011A2BA39|nr:hypothetical protein [Bartonella saheliensis]
MKQTLKLLSGSIWLLSMAGCYLGTPSTSSLDAWEKPGADFTEVAKAFLECGKPTPYDIDPENQKLSYNEKATVYACMVQAGFRDKVGGGTWCENHKAENLPICRPGAVIPQRSVKRRLNSPFCKKYKNSRKCQP